MPTCEQVEDFIEKLDIRDVQKSVLLRRLLGIYRADSEPLTDAQLDMIFEGLPALKDQLLEQLN